MTSKMPSIVGPDLLLGWINCNSSKLQWMLQMLRNCLEFVYFDDPKFNCSWLWIVFKFATWKNTTTIMSIPNSRTKSNLMLLTGTKTAAIITIAYLICRYDPDYHSFSLKTCLFYSDVCRHQLYCLFTDHCVWFCLRGQWRWI